MNVIKLIGRENPLFAQDVHSHEADLRDVISRSRFLVIGGAGSIGHAVAREIFKRNPKVLHLVDISENNMVEVVRDLRSTLGYIDGEFRTYALDCGSMEFDALMRRNSGYDYILNLSALKHVRSEEDQFTLMRMIEVNIFNTVKTVKLAHEMGAKKYFCVSTDKAANPVNMMGASKRIMEMFLMRESETQSISTARFANVAFSDGSLLHGFRQRFAKQQPLSAPRDIRRYFVTPQESGELCLLSCILGETRDIFFPKLSEELHLTTFSDIAVRFLQNQGYEPVECGSEDEARDSAARLIEQRKWPCFFFDSDTTGEKDFEEFYTDTEELDMERFENIGIVRNALRFSPTVLRQFSDKIAELRQRGDWEKQELVDLFNATIPNFNHKETGKYLDQKM